MKRSTPILCALLLTACGASPNDVQEPTDAPPEPTPIAAITLEGPYADYADYCAQSAYSACEEEEIIHSHEVTLPDGTTIVTTGGLIRDAQSQRRVFLAGTPGALFALPQTYTSNWDPDTDSRNHYGKVLGIRDNDLPEGTFGIRIQSGIEEPTDVPDDNRFTFIQTHYVCQTGSSPLRCIELPLEAGTTTTNSEGQIIQHVAVDVDGQPNLIEISELFNDPGVPNADVIIAPGVYEFNFE